MKIKNIFSFLKKEANCNHEYKQPEISFIIKDLKCKRCGKVKRNKKIKYN